MATPCHVIKSSMTSVPYEPKLKLSTQVELERPLHLPCLRLLHIPNPSAGTGPNPRNDPHLSDVQETSPHPTGEYDTRMGSVNVTPKQLDEEVAHASARTRNRQLDGEATC